MSNEKFFRLFLSAINILGVGAHCGIKIFHSTAEPLFGCWNRSTIRTRSKHQLPSTYGNTEVGREIDERNIVSPWVCVAINAISN